MEHINSLITFTTTLISNKIPMIIAAIKKPRVWIYL